MRVKIGINMADGNIATEMYHIAEEAVALRANTRYSIGGEINKE